MKTFMVTTNISHKTMLIKDGTEIEQRLVVEENGKVYFSSIVKENTKQQLGRSVECEIDKEKADEIIKRVEEYFTAQPSWSMLPRLGYWNVTLMKEDGGVETYYGSMTGAHADLSLFIEERIPVDDLYLFGK